MCPIICKISVICVPRCKIKVIIMKTRSKISLLGIAMLALLMSNCGKGGNDEPAPEPPKPVTITANPTSISLLATGGEQSFTVTTNADTWTVSSDASWLTASRQGSSVKLEAGVNTGAARNTTVRCTAGTVTATVSVSQVQMTVRQRDSLTLADFYTSTAGASWTKKWTLSAPMSQWQGVKVSSDGRITELNLPENNLSGAFPESFVSLTSLKSCDLHGNALTGVIPSGISQLTQLEFLDLSENSLSGAVPALNALTKLVVLDLSFNDFTALPALNSLTALEYLAFCNNRLNGSLPDNLSVLANLIYLDASNNSFSGNIPATWSSLTKMKVFYLYSNSLGGGIPAYLTSFASLEKLALDDNNLTGNIPETLGALSNLESLFLAQNRLSGSIPVSLLNHAKWTAWKNGVCPQQDGYGFGNCTSGGSSGSAPAKAKAKNGYKRGIMN